MATLSDITELDAELLEEKFQLEPRIHYDPNRSENLLFLSPLVLLEDLELREGGFQDRGAKEVLSRVAKHICKSKDSSLLQVPEITYFYMGYGKKSENKKCQMAINKEEAEVWMGFLNLSRFTREKNPKEGTSTSIEEEVPMDIDFPTPRDTQALDIEDTQQMEDHDSEDSVGPNDSGLQIPLKGSYVLLFSIFLIFFDKKQKSATSTVDEPKIGANKVSDFLLFWIIPYLLNYNHKKVREIVEHHRRVNGRCFTKTVKMSSLKVIEEAMESCQVSFELKQAIKTKYKDFYGTEQLECEYNLLLTTDGEPVILVPKRYKVTKMPAELEDIGTRWRELGDVKLTDEFMSKFIKNKAIQKDFLYNSFPHLTIRQGVDYAILFPDEETFREVIGQLENNSFEYLSRPKVYSKGGRNLITPCIGLVKNTEKNLAVCFSYFQGNKSKTVAALFRAVGAHYLDHFTLVLLHGLCLNPRDPQCKVGDLYPVSCARKVLFKGHRPRRPKKKEKGQKSKGKEKKSFSEGRGRFCKAEFPETYKSWERAVQSDPKVRDLISRSGDLKIDPKFQHDEPLTVAYSRAACAKKLGGDVAFGAMFAKTKEDLENYEVKAVNLNGFLLSMIARCGRKDNVGVVLAIKDACGKFGISLPPLSEAIVKIVANFVRAVIVGGLPKVYPSEPDEKDRDEIDSDSTEDDSDDDENDDDEDDVEQPTVSGLVSSDWSGNTIAASSSSSEASPRIKLGTPDDEVLEELGSDIGTAWKKLGRRLKVTEEEINNIDQKNEDLGDKGYKTLLHWKQSNGDGASYGILYDALRHKLVARSVLAQKYCVG